MKSTTLPLLWASLACTALMAACGGGGGAAATAPATTTGGASTGGGTPPATTAIDPTRLPVGDGKLSTTTPRVGYVYACSIPSSPNPPGKAPWISADGSTWDSTVKTSVGGAVAWNATFTLTQLAGMLNVDGNGLPGHATGIFPISPGDPAYAYDKNPNQIRSVPIAWNLPATPTVAAQPSCTSLGAIGVMLSGARLFNALDADGRDAAAHEVQDQCGGHPQAAGAYHYHHVSSCLSKPDTAGAHSALLGYIADGFGLYGNQGEGGKALSNADLDECHGHTHAISVNGVQRSQYHYHVTKEYPYTVGCYRGTPVMTR